MALSVFFLLLFVSVLAAGLCRRFLDPGSLFYLLDHPNHRSLHQTATPRSGGIAFIIAIAAGGAAIHLFGLVSISIGAYWLAGGCLLLAVTGYVDDHTHVSPLIRMAVHMIAAMVPLASGWGLAQLEVPGGMLQLGKVIGIIITVGYVVWMINLYNFMDGMDGFAGGMAVIGFSTLAVFGQQAGHYDYAVISLLVVAAVAGFLLWNFPPARIFMGDTGSSILGYLAAGMSLWGGYLDLFPMWIALLVFSPFIVDATWTLLKRAVRGERVWQAHREHVYQRLVQLGWGHRKTVLYSYVLMLGCAGSALALHNAEVGLQWGGISFWIVVYALIIGVVTFQKPHHPATSK